MTEAKLTEASSSVRKTEMKARVDEAVKAGRITEAYAKELKAQIDSADFSAGGFGERGGHHGRGGFGGPPPPDGGPTPPSATTPGSTTQSGSATAFRLA